MSEPYELRNFLETHQDWVAREQPDTERSIQVLTWFFTRGDDPYEGVRREEGFANYWYGAVPGTEADGQVVVCSYWIFEGEHAVRCDQLATLSTPL